MISNITLYSADLELKASIYDFQSVIWTTQYYEQGEFEIVVDYSDRYYNLFKQGDYACKISDAGTEKLSVGVVERIKYSFTPENGGVLTISGRLGISLIERRLIYQIVNYHPRIIWYASSGENIESAARAAVELIAITGQYGSGRDIAHLGLSTDMAGTTATVSKRVSSYQNLYSAITSLLATRNLAHRIYYNPLNNMLEYEVYAGQDRSNTLVFSRQRGNLLSFSYEADNTEWKNLIVIGGDGEGTQRFVTSVGTNGYTTGTERREVFYDAQSAKEDGTTDAAYAALLRNEAKQECRDMSKIVSVAAEIDLVNSGLQFGFDYNVGDIILVSDIIDYKPRITTVIESQNADGYTVDVEFNEEKPEEADE